MVEIRPKQLITEWRTSKKLTLREAARRIGISHPMLLNIERGKYRVTFRTSKKLAKAIRCSWKVLCDE